MRNIGPFSYFLDIVAANDGETVNFSNIARECGVTVKTVQQYYQILEDTFLAIRLPAWQKSPGKRLVTHPRYYMFDTGITNALAHTLGEELNPRVRGRRFEQFVIGQIMATAHYQRQDVQFYYWRTNHGAEVDLLLCRGEKILAAIEIKSARNITMQGLSGLRSFKKSHPRVPAYVLGDDGAERLLDENITVISWDEFLAGRFPELME